MKITHTPLSSLKKMVATSAVIFLVHEPSKSVLLFESNQGLRGYIFEDPEADYVVKEKAVKDLLEKTGIIVEESNPYCPDILEEITSESEGESKWKFVIVIKNFHVNQMPSNAKWYNINQIRYSRIHDKSERESLRKAMKSMRIKKTA